MRSIKFRKYKAFESGELELKPLTLLLGANSSGKSSILHLLLMLEQTINNKEDYKSAFRSNGHYVSMGEDVNLLKDLNRQSNLSLEFSVKADEYINELKSFQSYLYQDLILGYLLNLKHNSPQKLKEFEESTKDLMNEIIEQRFQGSADTVKTYLKENHPKNDGLLSILLDNQFVQERMKTDWWKKYSYDKDILLMMSLLDDCFHSFANLCEETIGEACLSYSFSYNKRIKKLVVRECQIKINEKNLMTVSFYRNKPTLTSDIFVKENLEKLVELSSLSITFSGLSIKRAKDSNSPFDAYVYNIFSIAYSSIKTYFAKDNFNYIGPLRANPQRYYFLDDSNTNTFFDFYSGERIAELLKSDSKLSAQINKWMRNFGLNIKVTEFRDVIHKIKVRQNSLSLDLPDVGFGVSQVLPILIDGVLSGNNTTTIMEQPEIHLHPKMQAELADFFIEVVNHANHDNKQPGRRYVIETHSEYILKRIRRRIAEGVISPDDVAIYFIEPRSDKGLKEAIIRKSLIESDGTIEWPSDFYMTGYEDEMAFFKKKIEKSDNHN